MVRAELASWGCPDCGDRVFGDLDELATLAKRHYAVVHPIQKPYHFPARCAALKMRISEPG